MEKEFTLQELEEFIGDAVHDFVADKFRKRCQEHSFKTEHQYEDYGDTEVEVAQFIDEEDETEFREETEKEFDVDSILEELCQDESFRESIKDMIDHIVWKRPLDI